MKTKAFKFVIPTMAIIFALVASAFTAVDTSITGEANLQGYVFSEIPGQPCNEIEVDCTLEGAMLCREGGKQVYADMSGTSCSTELYRQ